LLIIGEATTEASIRSLPFEFGRDAGVATRAEAHEVPILEARAAVMKRHHMMNLVGRNDTPPLPTGETEGVLVEVAQPKATPRAIVPSLGSRALIYFQPRVFPA